MKNENNFSGRTKYNYVIPGTVLHSTKLTANAKLLYGVISSLSNQEGYCFASNEYFAEMMCVHYDTITSWVSELKKENHIFCKQQTGDFRHIFLSTPGKKTEGGSVIGQRGGRRKDRGGVGEKADHTSLSILFKADNLKVEQQPPASFCEKENVNNNLDAEANAFNYEVKQPQEVSFMDNNTFLNDINDYGINTVLSPTLSKITAPASHNQPKTTIQKAVALLIGEHPEMAEGEATELIGGYDRSYDLYNKPHINKPELLYQKAWANHLKRPAYIKNKEASASNFPSSLKNDSSLSLAELKNRDIKEERDKIEKLMIKNKDVELYF